MSDQTITSLIEKLEGAEKPSQELSARVIHAVRVPDGSVEQSKLNGRWCVYDKNGRLLENSGRNGWWREAGWDVTESLDAALALAERVLPGWVWEITILQDETSVQGAPEIWPEGLAAPDREGVSISLRTPALALCAAILRAQSEAR